jgi:hypothetical protein
MMLLVCAAATPEKADPATGMRNTEASWRNLDSTCEREVRPSSLLITNLRISSRWCNFSITSDAGALSKAAMANWPMNGWPCALFAISSNSSIEGGGYFEVPHVWWTAGMRCKL